MNKKVPDQLVWWPDGYEVALDNLSRLEARKREPGSSEGRAEFRAQDAKELDRGIRDRALWHRLFGSSTPFQPFARCCESAIPPGWRPWRRPLGRNVECAFDLEIEKALRVRSTAWRTGLEQTGVRCLYVEVRAELRRWFWDIERGHNSYCQRTEIAGKLSALLSSSSKVLRAVEEMEEAVAYLSSVSLPQDQDDIDPFTRVWELYDEDAFDDQFGAIVEHLVKLEAPTKRYLTYFSPLERPAGASLQTRGGRKRGTGIDIRRRLFGISGLAMFAFLNGSFPGESNRAFEDFLSDLERTFFADEDTLQVLPSEAARVVRRDIRSLATSSVHLLKWISDDERAQLVPETFGQLTLLRTRLRQIFEQSIYKSWEDTDQHPFPDPPSSKVGPT